MSLRGVLATWQSRRIIVFSVILALDARIQKKEWIFGSSPNMTKAKMSLRGALAMWQFRQIIVFSVILALDARIQEKSGYSGQARI